MDTAKLIEVLRASIEPNQRLQAEEQLAQIHKIIGFAPSLLQVVMQNDVPTTVRQAGAVYLKNMITAGWQEKEPEEGEPIPFSIHEQDRAMIRNMIVEATVQAPDYIRIQLSICLKTVIKYDFPARWTEIVDKIHIYLQNPDPGTWMGALHCLYALIKSYEYQNEDKRGPLIEAMNLLLPMMYNIMISLQPDQSAESVLIQKQILKCYYGLIKYTLNLELLTKEVFTKWMEVLRLVLSQHTPETLALDDDDLMELPWWKSKKWAIHTLYRIFERYGSPVTAREEYTEFAEWYLTTFTGGILEVLLRILDQYRNHKFVSPRVLQQTLSYIEHCLSHAHCWKLLKPHMFAIIQDVLFPMLCYTDDDEDLWYNDPHEYIRIKFDIFEDFVSPVVAAQNLLSAACRKRKDMFGRTMQLCMQVITSTDNNEYGPRKKDGALHMVGTLHELLIKKKQYREEISTLLSQYVYPEFRSPLGHMRARVCWVIQNFSGIHYRSDALLLEAMNLTVGALLNDSDLPVKVEAAIAIQMLLASQEKAHAFLMPHVKEVTTELLEIIRETENDNIASVLQKVVTSYTEQLLPMAYEMTDHLATTFSRVIETDSGTDEKAITAMGLLNTLETVVSAMEDSPEIMTQIEKTVLRVVGHILHNNIVEYYEEAMSLLCNLTARSISEDCWKVLELLYKCFENDAFDYFTDMMPVLHNYITVDTNAFVSNENHILVMFNMVKQVLNVADAKDECELYAAKLLEVMVLQCTGKIDNCLPSFVELVLNRLTRKMNSSELRTMLLQVLIAILYYNPHLLFTILDKLQESVPNASITQHFIKQWIHDTDCFMGIHDRKLCVLGICTLLEMGASRPNLDEVMPKLLPSCLVLFDGLQRAYEAQAEGDSDSSSEEEEDEEDDEVLSSDDDEVEDDYLEKLARMAVKNSAEQGVNMTAKILEDDSDDDDDGMYADFAIECYTTPLDDKDCVIDEYIKFKNTLLGLSNSDPALYHTLMSTLNEQQQKKLSAIFVLADQRKAQQDSKRIEQSGGYSFTVPAQVPTKFKFGS